MKITLGLALIVISALAGCTATYTWDDKQIFHHTHYHFDGQKALAVTGAVVDGLSNAAAAYGRGVADYAAEHPTVTVQPQHGIMDGWVGDQFVWVSY